MAWLTTLPSATIDSRDVYYEYIITLFISYRLRRLVTVTQYRYSGIDAGSVSGLATEMAADGKIVRYSDNLDGSSTLTETTETYGDWETY